MKIRNGGMEYEGERRRGEDGVGWRRTEGKGGGERRREEGEG